MSRIDDDTVINTLVSKRASQPFSINILPWRLGRSRFAPDSHGGQAWLHEIAIDAVTITDELTRLCIPETSFVLIQPPERLAWAMIALLLFLLALMTTLFKTIWRLESENAALRQQLNVMLPGQSRPRLTN